MSGIEYKIETTRDQVLSTLREEYLTPDVSGSWAEWLEEAFTEVMSQVEQGATLIYHEPLGLELIIVEQGPNGQDHQTIGG